MNACDAVGTRAGKADEMAWVVGECGQCAVRGCEGRAQAEGGRGGRGQKVDSRRGVGSQRQRQWDSARGGLDWTVLGCGRGHAGGCVRVVQAMVCVCVLGSGTAGAYGAYLRVIWMMIGLIACGAYVGCVCGEGPQGLESWV